MPDYREHIEQARDLLELAAQTSGGRTAIRKWAAEVTAALDQQEAGNEPADPAAERRAAQVRAAQDLGYTNIALSETGGSGPAIMLGGQ
jgi:hypothetical protein